MPKMGSKIQKIFFYVLCNYTIVSNVRFDKDLYSAEKNIIGPFSQKLISTDFC